jgi:hypothetical protein
MFTHFKYTQQPYRKMTKQERIDSFMRKCFILCPRCLSIHPFGTKTCTTCMEILEPKERIFQQTLHNNENILSKQKLLKVEK